MKLFKNILFSLLMIMLGLPLIQRTVPVFDETPLKGAFTVPQKPTCSYETVLEGTFQEAYNDYFEHTIGFRPLLVRINNQIAYSVFDTALANGVIIGKENHLFEINYIKAIKGWDFSGEEVIETQVQKAAFVHQKLKEANKTLLFVFAPGKASFFPEYIPDKYLNSPSGKNTNYAVFSEKFKKYNLPLIDFNSWFMLMKDTVSYSLYPQCGIHWSAYGVAMATDSLINFIEKDRNIDMVDFGWNGFEFPDTLRSPDYDIAEGMNLLFRIPTYKMAYPKVWFGKNEGKTRPNVIVVADSYYWNIFGIGYSSRIFNDNNFWYYNTEAHNPAWPSSRKTADLDMLGELGKADVIIIMATEANLYRFPYGFIDRAYEVLSVGVDLSSSVSFDDAKNNEIAAIMKNIDSNTEWKEKVRQKAVLRKISYEEMLLLDATWVWNNKRE